MPLFPPPPNTGFPGPMPGATPVPGTTPPPTPGGGGSNGPCLHGSHPGPNGSQVCNPAPGAGGAGDFGGAFKPWESIDTTISQDQWKAWEGFRDPSCPANKPYKSERGAPGCFEKPVDCPDGQMPGGPGNSPCVPNPKGGGGAGSAYVNDGESPAAKAYYAAIARADAGTATPADWNLINSHRTAQGKPLANAQNWQSFKAGNGGAGGGESGMLWNSIAGILSGGTRFSPEVMADIEGQAKLGQQQALRTGTQQLRESQAARGVFSSPLGASQEAQLQNASAQDFNSTMAQMRVNKATADFEDKMQGINSGLKWLQDLHSYNLGMESNNVAREGIAANLELGYANIKSQMSLMMQGFLNDKELLSMNLDSKEYENMNQMILCINMGLC